MEVAFGVGVARWRDCVCGDAGGVAQPALCERGVRRRRRPPPPPRARAREGVERNARALSSHVLEVHKRWRVRQQRDGDGSERLVIGLVGVPGSGKSSVMRAMMGEFHRAAPALGVAALPMDGFHYTRAQLRSFDDPDSAFKYRGAPFTFDAERFVQKLREVRHGRGRVGYAPAFDHARGDPDDDAIVIAADAEIVLVEGNYLLLEECPWCEAGSLLRCSYYLDVPLAVAMQRVATRHEQQMKLGAAEARRRVESNDRPNALRVIESAPRATLWLNDGRLTFPPER